MASEKKKRIARADGALAPYDDPAQGCSIVELIADLMVWSEENDLDWPCIIAAAEQEYLSAR